jgi:CO/xanthine dehydrogenase FAD-binding subunit
MGEFFRPTDRTALVSALRQRDWRFLAGGTDYFPSIVGVEDTSDILDLTAIADFKEINETSEGWILGATTSWSKIISHEFPPLFNGLKHAAREVGGKQIQTSGTIAGNICNASPAADGVAALLALDAQVEILSAEGTRYLAIDEFVLGSRKTALELGEVVSSIHIPKPQNPNTRGYFYKLGSRKYLVISLVMVAGSLALRSDGTIVDVRIVVGACSEVACRLKSLENNLKGLHLSDNLTELLKIEHFATLNPIDDVRATKEYRIDAAYSLVRKMLSDWGQNV